MAASRLEGGSASSLYNSSAVEGCLHGDVMMTWQGEVVSIQIGAKAGEPLQAVSEVRVLSGQGIEGDRYFARAGTFSKKHSPEREVTLIEVEALEALERE